MVIFLYYCYSFSMNLKQLQTILEKAGEKPFRYKQAVNFYFTSDARSWDDVSVLGKDIRAKLAAALPFCLVTVKKQVESDDVIKFVFKLAESDHLVESVVMKHNDGRRTICLSCQAGCAMGCYFCATGTMGLQKNLSAYEIIDMVREVNIFLQRRGEHVSNVVFMGMGEPFTNYPAVRESLHVLHDHIGLGWRKLTISTCGIVPKIMEFAKDFPQVNLAISLHAATNEKRSKLMPVNTKFPLEMLMPACRAYVETTGRKLFFEYLVIEGFNDQMEDVRALSRLLDHPLYHLNLIRFHATSATQSKYGIAWKAPTRASLDTFMKQIEETGISYTLRRSFGERIDAACGMLALAESKNRA